MDDRVFQEVERVLNQINTVNWVLDGQFQGTSLSFSVSQKSVTTSKDSLSFGLIRGPLVGLFY